MQGKVRRHRKVKPNKVKMVIEKDENKEIGKKMENDRRKNKNKRKRGRKYIIKKGRQMKAEETINKIIRAKVHTQVRRQRRNEQIMRTRKMIKRKRKKN